MTKTIALTILAILAIAGLSSWYFLSQPSQETPTPETTEKTSEITKQPEPQATTTTEQIDTSGWKVYRNEKYGFEVRYPRDWIIQEFDKKFKILSPDDMKILSSAAYTDQPAGYGLITFKIDKVVTLEEWLKEYFQLNSLEIEPIEKRKPGRGMLVDLIEKTLVGEKNQGYLLHEGGLVEGVYTYFVKQDDVIIGIEAYYQKNLSDQIFQKILKNFRFLNN